jgi:hypothetical protein
MKSIRQESGRAWARPLRINLADGARREQHLPDGQRPGFSAGRPDVLALSPPR